MGKLMKRLLPVLVLAFSTLSAQESELATKAVGVLEKNCWGCHGPSNSISDLRLSSRESILKGGTRGPAAVAGNAKDSLMIGAIKKTDPDLWMPPDSKLAASDIDIIEKWIAAGAEWPKNGPVVSDTWWSFKKPVRPEVPVLNSSWVKNPIDAFILKKLTAEKLKPAKQADRATLIRRAYLDLHGLPPTVEQVKAFVNDPAADAYDKLIDTLLESQRYGEKWGRHWLDLARYGDTSGFEQDPYMVYAWRYRDWVIESINKDKPYDRFVKEQIAGDELYPDDPPSISGTGFYTVGPNRDMLFKVEDINRLETLQDWVDTTGSVFLGLTVGCARCHDHKFDPIPQRDYKALEAIFQGAEKTRVALQYDPSKQYDLAEVGRQVRLFEIAEQLQALGGGGRGGRGGGAAAGTATANTAATAPVPATTAPVAVAAPAVTGAGRGAAGRGATASAARGNAAASAAQPATTTTTSPATAPAATNAAPAATGVGAANAAAVPPAGGGRGRGGAPAQLSPEDQEKQRALEQQLVQMFRTYAPGPFAPGIKDIGRESPTRAYLPARNGRPPEAVPAGFLTVLGGGTVPTPPIEATTSGGRKALAGWIATEDNPLFARVMVNRMWHYHFGKGLVINPSDFGHRGGLPSHPELLDWLTTEFVKNGWSMKKMHKLMMTSSVYMQSTETSKEAVDTDAPNAYLSHFNRRRLLPEEIRDSMLQSAGVLNLKMGGRPVVPELAREELFGLSGGNFWQVSANTAEHTRRSIYMLVRRTFRPAMFESFDAPDGILSHARRNESNTAPQSLTLLNGQWTTQEAGRLADKLAADNADEADLIKKTWNAVYARDPRPKEVTDARTFIEKQTVEVGSKKAAVAELVRALFNTNEFLYVE